MENRKYLHFFVNCPGEAFKKVEMSITMIRSENGWFPLPCNGCEEMNGTMPCKECIRDITLMFYRDPDLDISNPITPAAKAD